MDTFRHIVNFVTDSSVASIVFPHSHSLAGTYLCETEYNLLNQPSRIAEGEVELLLFYGADGQRNKVVFKRNGVVERTRYYISANYEKEIAADNTVTHYNYIYSPTGLAIVCVRRNNIDSLYYVYPDRLGSYTHITNSSKQVVRALHFDPWGNVKSDADNFVQAPEFTQSYNRYSYCLNNPLQYVDPSGESFIALGVAIGALTNVFSQMVTGNINSASNFLFSTFVGGFTGVISGIAGNAAVSSLGVGGFIGGFASGAASGASGGAIIGFGNSLVAGNNLSTSIRHSFFSSFVGALGGGLTGGLAGGVWDALNGYAFGDGSRIDEFAVSDTPIVQDLKKMGILYDNSDIAECNDVYLKYRIENVFGIKECDFEIDVITTRTGGYGLTQSGLYVNRQGVSVGGYVRSFSFGSSDLHISPYYTNAADIPFQAIVGHELLHSYHHYILGASFQRIWSEMVAYQYTYNVYMSNNMYKQAFSTVTTAIRNYYWGYFYPSIYSIPSPYILY